MKRLTNNPPCKDCTEDIQIGNPYVWQTPCYSCRKKEDWISDQRVRLGKIEDILGDDYDLERLAELIKADRDGRCVVLPCKVGDKIYKLFCGNVLEIEVERIVCWQSGYWKVNAHTKYSHTDWKGFEIDFSDFGKTVFLTRETAEAALKERESR